MVLAISLMFMSKWWFVKPASATVLAGLPWLQPLPGWPYSSNSCPGLWAPYWLLPAGRPLVLPSMPLDFRFILQLGKSQSYHLKSHWQCHNPCLNQSCKIGPDLWSCHIQYKFCYLHSQQRNGMILFGLNLGTKLILNWISNSVE